MALIVATAGLSWLAVAVGVLHVARATGTSGADRGAILVLGHRLLPDSRPSAAFQARLARAGDLWRAQPDRRVLVLGGASRAGQATEAAVGRATLLSDGMPEDRIAVEERSRHTLENLRGVRAALGGAEPSTLVTGRPHLARAGIMARGMGLCCSQCAAEPALGRQAALAIPREAFLLHWYITGRLVARLIRSRRLAARVT